MTSHEIGLALADTNADLRGALAVALEDNAGLLGILREIDLSSPAQAEALLARAAGDAHPGRTLMGTALAELTAARAVVAAGRLTVAGPDSANYARLADAIDAYDATMKRRAE